MSVTHCNLEVPIDYKIEFMGVYTKSEDTENGRAGQEMIVVAHSNGEYSAIDPAISYFIKLLDDIRFGDNSIVGRGTLIERIDGSRWFVAWRSFSPIPKFKSSLDKDKVDDHNC
jgi:hypothetical protein